MHVGLLGCGKISGIYLKNLMGQRGAVRVTACADAAPQAAKATAAEWGIRAMAPDELLEAADIDCILLLTPPAAHFELGMQVLESGKHLYVEKPLALTVSQGKMLLKRARDKPVSYTHLDVYKRQAWSRPQGTSWRARRGPRQRGCSRMGWRSPLQCAGPCWACLLYTSSRAPPTPARPTCWGLQSCTESLPRSF